MLTDIQLPRFWVQKMGLECRLKYMFCFFEESVALDFYNFIQPPKDIQQQWQSLGW